jgi:catechol 2,3-dioxygenase-like lactoylglutathione lyase family enzyme
MLGHYEVSVSLAVKDIMTARNFYKDKLGLLVEKEGLYECTYSSGHVKLQIYVSSEAGTNKGTAATWEVDNIEGEVAELRSKGIEFEHYANSNMELHDDVYSMDGEKAAWFKDPDGNILCLHNGKPLEQMDVRLS